MPKPKYLKQAKAKSKEQRPNTADDFQAAGVEFEEAAGKWRAGDAAKSMRFFQRAVDVYGQGLQIFPRNFDLAYNIARVQLEMATHPILVSQLSQPLNMLEEALASHRHALRLDPDDADALFNTSQVLTAIAEMDTNEVEAVKLLREALDLQGRCLGIQEKNHQEFLEQERVANQQTTTSDQTLVSHSGESVSEDEGWFNVVEPVTRDTLIDTVLAQLGTLTTLCSILSSSPDAAPAHTFPRIEELSMSLVEKAQTFSRDQPNRVQEIALARGNFVSAMFEAGYRSGKVDAETYMRERDAAFAKADLHLEGSEGSESAEGLIANARSLLAFNSALTDSENGDAQSYSTLRWNALTASIANLKSASTTPNISQEDLAMTHLLRGDTSLFLYGMAFPPTSHPTAVNGTSQNAKNAEVYYRNASRLTKDPEEKDVSLMKLAVTQYLQTYSQGHAPDDLSTLLSASPRDQGWALEQLEDMITENLVPRSVTISLKPTQT